jgi:hypothetical protein
VEFAPVERKTTGGVSHLGRMANIQPLAGEETQRYLVVPLLGGCAGKSRSGDNCPLYGCLSTNCGNFIVNRQIWELCAGAVRKRGSRVKPFWWDQPMDLELARERGNMPPPPRRLWSLQPLRTRTRIGVGLWSPIPVKLQFLELGMQTRVGPLPERWLVLV